MLPTIITTSMPKPDERVEVAEREPDRAVAEQQDELAVRVRDAGRERVARPHPEAPERAGVEEAAGLVAVDELAGVRHEVAAVADHDRVAVEARPQLAVDALRLDRRGRGLEADRVLRPPRPLLVAEPRDPVVVRRLRRPRRRAR